MTKVDYLDALKRALSALPDHVISATVADYEKRFTDGMSFGRSEADIASDLGTPEQVAAKLNPAVQFHAFKEEKTVRSFWRFLMSLLGLLIFNFFMIIPAFVFTAMLFASYAVALAFYVSGIAITASGLSGVGEIEFDGPFKHFMISDARDDGQPDLETRMEIDHEGIHIHQEANPALKSVSASASAASTATAVENQASAHAMIQIDPDNKHHSRTRQTFQGIGLTLGGIILFLLSLVVTKYTFIGIKRYVLMNVSMLKNA